jgi:hypothetical protein
VPSDIAPPFNKNIDRPDNWPTFARASQPIVVAPEISIVIGKTNL